MQEQHCFCAWSSCCEKIHHCLIYASYVWTKFDKFWQWQILNLELYRAHTLHACTSAMYSRCSNSCTHDPITLHRCTDTYISLWTWRPFPTSSLSMCGWGRTWHKWVWSKGVADRYKPFIALVPLFKRLEGWRRLVFSPSWCCNDTCISLWRLNLHIWWFLCWWTDRWTKPIALPLAHVCGV